MTTTNPDKKPEAAAKPAAPSEKKKGPKAVGKKKVAGKVSKKVEPMSSKAALIRKVAGLLKSKGEVVRPKTIVEILKKEGVVVAPAQVSMTLKAAGYRPLRKRRKASKIRSDVQAPSKGRKADAVTVDDLLAVKKVVQQLGGTDRAMQAIEALKRLEE
jgi:hypothetical protein